MAQQSVKTNFEMNSQDNTDFSGLKNKLNNVKRAAKETRHNLAGISEGIKSGLGKPMIAFGAVSAASTAAAIKLGEFSERMDNVQARTALSMDTIQEFNHLMVVSGSNSQQAAEAMNELTMRLGEIRSGDNNELVKMFQDVKKNTEGINLDLESLSKMEPDQRFWRTLEMLSKIQNTSVRNNLADKFFGGEVSQSILSFMDKGPEFIQKMRDEAGKDDLIIPPDEIQNVKQAKANLNELGEVLNKTLLRAMARLGPEISQVTERMKNSDGLINSVSNSLKGFTRITTTVINRVMELGKQFNRLQAPLESLQQKQDYGIIDPGGFDKSVDKVDRLIQKERELRKERQKLRETSGVQDLDKIREDKYKLGNLDPTSFMKESRKSLGSVVESSMRDTDADNLIRYSQYSPENAGDALQQWTEYFENTKQKIKELKSNASDNTERLQELQKQKEKQKEILERLISLKEVMDYSSEGNKKKITGYLQQMREDIVTSFDINGNDDDKLEAQLQTYEKNLKKLKEIKSGLVDLGRFGGDIKSQYQRTLGKIKENKARVESDLNDTSYELPDGEGTSIQMDEQTEKVTKLQSAFKKLKNKVVDTEYAIDSYGDAQSILTQAFNSDEIDTTSMSLDNMQEKLREVYDTPQDKFNEEWEELVDTIDGGSKSSKEFANAMMLINTQLQRNNISYERYIELRKQAKKEILNQETDAERLKSIRNEFMGAQQNVKKLEEQLRRVKSMRVNPEFDISPELIGKIRSRLGEAKKEAGQLSYAMEKFSATVKPVVQTVGSQIETQMINLVDKGKFKWKDFGETIRNELVRAATQAMIVKPMIESITTSLNQMQSYGSFSSLLGGGGGGGSGIFGGFMAEGGSVSPSKSYIVGEKGPELFKPSSSGTIVPNKQINEGTSIKHGDDRKTIVNVNNYGNSRGSNNDNKAKRSDAQMATKLASAIARKSRS